MRAPMPLLPRWRRALATIRSTAARDDDMPRRITHVETTTAPRAAALAPRCGSSPRGRPTRAPGPVRPADRWQARATRRCARRLPPRLRGRAGDVRSLRGHGRRDAARRAVLVPGGQVVAAHRRRVRAGAGDRRDPARVADVVVPSAHRVRPVGAGRGQATYPFRSWQGRCGADCRPRTCGRPQFYLVAPRATTGVLDTCGGSRVGLTRAGRPVYRRDPGVVLAAGGTPLAGRLPVRQPHACPSRLARCSRQHRRSPCHPPAPGRTLPWRTRPPAVQTASGWRGSLAPAWAWAEHAPRARA